MSATIEAKTAIRHLGAEAQALVANKSLSGRQKNARLDQIEAEMKSHSETIAMHAQARQWAAGGSSAESGEGGAYVGGKSFGPPSLSVDSGQAEALHHAATSKQNLKVTTKVAAFDFAAAAAIPTGLSPQLVAFRREPTRVASLFPVSPMPGPSIEYVRHTGNTGAAGTVAPGGAKPEVTLVTDTIVAVARKIAAHIGVVDETLYDFGTTSGYLSNELVHAVVATENTQLLSGNGVAPNMQGVLTTTGILTRTQAVAPETALDTLELAMNDLRVGSSFTECDGLVLHPSDFSALRLAKDTQGRYLLGAPTEGEPATLWGKPVVVTTSIPAKTALVGNFSLGGAVMFRQGTTLEVQSTGSDWTSNVTRFRCEERLAVVIYRPSAFVKVTLT